MLDSWIDAIWSDGQIYTQQRAIRGVLYDRAWMCLAYQTIVNACIDTVEITKNDWFIQWWICLVKMLDTCLGIFWKELNKVWIIPGTWKAGESQLSHDCYQMGYSHVTGDTL